MSHPLPRETSLQDQIDELLRIAHNTLIKTQQLTAEQHVRTLDRYFERDGRPATREYQLPASTYPLEYHAFDIPLMSIIAEQTVRLASFETTIRSGDVHDHDSIDRDDALPGAVGDTRDPVLEMRFTFEATEAPDAYLRIKDLLTRHAQVRVDSPPAVNAEALDSYNRRQLRDLIDQINDGRPPGKKLSKGGKNTDLVERIHMALRSP